MVLAAFFSVFDSETILMGCGANVCVSDAETKCGNQCSTGQKFVPYVFKILEWYFQTRVAAAAAVMYFDIPEKQREGGEEGAGGEAQPQEVKLNGGAANSPVHVRANGDDGSFESKNNDDDMP
jgi:hypothetical protein